MARQWCKLVGMMKTTPPVLVVIGAGSLFFGRQVIWAAAHLAGLKGCNLRLVDTSPANLERMVKLGRMVVAEAGATTTVEGYSDYREALPGADFVVLSFSRQNAHYRRIDCEVSARFGIRMCSGDTIGPGGVFRTLREFPVALEVARAMEEACPDAWLINYVNPSAILGIGLMRHARVKSFALCDAQHLPHKKESYLKMLGETAAPGELDLRIAGVNHFTWMLKAELRGEDILPRLAAAFREGARKERDTGYSKGRFNHTISAQLHAVFGALPTVTGHTKEYLPYYQGHAAIRETVPPLSVFDCDERDERTAAMWAEVDAYVSGETPISTYRERFKSDHATDIIETMLTGNGRTYFVNRANAGAVSNLPDDAFLELECAFGPDGPTPLPAGEFPLGLRSLQMQILDAHELTIEAIMKQDRGLLVRALAIDPLVQSIATAEAVIDALYARQTEILPAWVGTRVAEDAASSGAGSGAKSEFSPQLY